MDTLKCIVLFATIPAVLCANTFNLGENCTTSCDALHSLCENNKCVCEENYFELSGECAAGLGAQCYHDQDCKLNNTICNSWDTCVCNPNFVAAPDNSKCLSKLPDKCTEAEECLASNSECKNGRCQCLPGRSLVNGECAYELGSYCEKSGDCAITNSGCFDNKCTCLPYHFEFSGQCLAGVNASCLDNYQCKAKHSSCLEKKCQCKVGFAATPDYQCLPIAQHHKPCKYDLQCSTALPHTFCNVTDEGPRCECTAKYFFKEGECYPRKYVPDKCDRWDECFTPNSYCKNGQCDCLPSYKLEDGACNNSSTIDQPLFFIVALILLGMKIMS